MKLIPIKPKPSLGQHFLTDQNIAEKIARYLSFQADDWVIEIGAGQGSLSQVILPKVSHLFAVELDQRLIAILESRFGHAANFQLIQGDFLTLPIETLIKPDHKLRVVGNIPYNITSPVIFKVIDQRAFVHDMTLMVQREVAQRIVARPGNKDYGILSVISQAYAEVEILFNVSRTVFTPIPKVDSAVVYWKFDSALEKAIDDEVRFRLIVRTAFSQRRKMLRNSLKQHIGNKTAIAIPMDQRPEQLSVKEWIDLSNALSL